MIMLLAIILLITTMLDGIIKEVIYVDKFEKAFIKDLETTEIDVLTEMYANTTYYSNRERELIYDELIDRGVSEKKIAKVLQNLAVYSLDEANISDEDKYDEYEEYNNLDPGLETSKNGSIYSIKGVRGRHIDVFDNKCIITTKVTIGSLLTHNATDGAKTIYYADVVGVQFKEPGITIGYLQLETPGLTMNNAASNFFNENSFTFDTTVISTEKMREVAAYVENRVQEIKHPKVELPAQVAPTTQFSVADELLKFKQLLDMGVLTQEEFDKKKNELLNL